MNIKELKDIIEDMSDDYTLDLGVRGRNLYLNILDNGEYLERRTFKVMTKREALINTRVDYLTLEYSKDLQDDLNKYGKMGYRISQVLQGTCNTSPKIILFRRY